MGVEQITAFFGERQAAFVSAEIHGLDKAFIAEVAERIVVCVEVLVGHDSERADGSQRAAVLAIQLVHTVAVHDQFKLVAARQIQVVHQRVAWIVIVSVPLAVDAGAAVVAIPVVVIARIVPSSVRHRPSWRTARAGWVVREDALAVSARVCSRKRRGTGACRRGD